jgi:hypothetical protein
VTARCVVCDIDLGIICRRITCSDDCKKAYRNSRPIRPVKQCVNCGGDFIGWGSNKTCSRKCKRLRREETNRNLAIQSRSKRYEQAKQRRLKNLEKHRAIGRQNALIWRMKYPEKVRETKQKRETKRTAAVELLKLMQDESLPPKQPRREKSRKWALENRAKRCQYARDFRLKHPEIARERKRRSEAKRSAAMAIVRDLQNGVMP